MTPLTRACSAEDMRDVLITMLMKRSPACAEDLRILYPAAIWGTKHQKSKAQALLAGRHTHWPARLGPALTAGLRKILARTDHHQGR